jgi:hypothetical protein
MKQERMHQAQTIDSMLPSRSAAGKAMGRIESRARAWWQRAFGMGKRPPRRLRLSETLALGERRFVAVVEFDRSRFLVGGTANSLVLLARLESDSGEGALRMASPGLPPLEDRS